MSSVTPIQISPQPWYVGLTPRHWKILFASFVGWIFDGYEAFALIIALRSLLSAEQLKSPAKSQY
jgi:hypothetical protein